MSGWVEDEAGSIDRVFALDDVVAAAAQGLGVALETLRFAQPEIDAGSLIRFGGERFRNIWGEIHFLCSRTRDQNALKVGSFSDWILGEASSEPLSCTS